MRIQSMVLVCCIAAVPANAVPLVVEATPFGTGSNFLFRYDVAEPTLKAGQTITSLTETASVLTSKTGKNNNPASTTLQGELVPNPLLNPPPDCKKTPSECILSPAVTAGVNPNQLATAPAQFPFNQAGSTLTKGANMNVAGDPKNLNAPIAGSTQRTDTVSLLFNASPPINFFPTKIANKVINALTFGGEVNYDRGSFTNARKNTVYLPSKETIGPATWTLSDGTTVAASITRHTIVMGMNEPGANGTLVASLMFSYTNDDTQDVTLSDLGFQTSGSQVALDAMGLEGTPLFNPVVTLNGIAQSLQANYDVPSGDTLDFLFPVTTDPFFIVEGDVSTEAGPQFGFAYEEQVIPTPEPASFGLLGFGAALLGLRRWAPRVTPRRRSFRMQPADG